MLKKTFFKTFVAVSFSAVLESALFFSGSTSSLWTTKAHASSIFTSLVQKQGFADIVDQVKPAVVAVQVKNTKKKKEDWSFKDFFSGPGMDKLPDQHPLKRLFKEFYNFDKPKSKFPHRSKRLHKVGFGSGFFISSDGYVVTNDHVISVGTGYIVILDDGTELDAKLIGTDPKSDLAVLKVDDKRKFSYVDFGDDSKLKVGDWVVAIGNPFGLGGTVTAGIVSARGRDLGTGIYNDFIQIDAAINKGNSGGPTFDLNGKVVAVNTAILTPPGSGGNVGIAFAIPAGTVKQVVQELIEKGSVERGWLGVSLQPVTKEISDSIGLKEAKGALVADSFTGPAAKAGIKAGDVVISINNEKIANRLDLAKRIANTKPGETVTVGIWRSGKEESIKVKLASRPANEDKKEGSKFSNGRDELDETLEDYGLIVVPSDDGIGVVVTDVDIDSDAADKGIRPGDIIVTVNNKPVKNVSDIISTIEDAQQLGRKTILLQVRTNDENRFVALPIFKK
ncbi:Do family serine endopeptidase [Bartonella tribocorum]|uniref:Probable periplasmic serine endoprotease DegP-like n=1 Tax=Bartonella tribocorum TaxID=85701 RepID=A0A2M6URU5_9HYPH|nr:Do family serine endopeptidase [Bartonella tribocorum]PIT68899.1 serine peptidase [Bartonella tribocorum]